MSSDEAFDILFEIEKSLRYHHRRRAFYDNWHKVFMFVIIIFGSGSVAATADSLASSVTWGWVPAGIGFAVATIGALDIVVAFSDRARDHEFLYRRFSELMKDIRRNITPSADDLASWRIRRIEIESDEPAIYWAIEAACYNEVANAFDRDPTKKLKISWWRGFFRNYIMFDPTVFQPIGNRNVT